MNLLADRRREEKERRRDEILDAAAAVAAEAGLDTITMDQVARRARLSRALLYVYFLDRTDLLLGLCQRAIDLLLQRFVDATAREPSGLDRLSAMGRAYIAFAQELPVYFEVLARFEASSGGDVAMPVDGNFARCMAGGDRVHEVLTDAIRAGVTDGSIRGDVGNADAVAIVLWGFMHGVIQLVATKGAMLVTRGVTPELLFEQARELALQSLKSAPA
jgi:TetR/AcrR family transcriptional regulator